MSVPPNAQRELSLAIVGIGFPNTDRAKSNRRFEIELCAPGDPLELRREPKNPHDPHAVAVFSERGIQLGYLTAERAPWIGAKIGTGEEWHAVYQGLAEGAAYARIRFGGGAPTLPARPTENDGFRVNPNCDWGA